MYVVDIETYCGWHLYLCLIFRCREQVNSLDGPSWCVKRYVLVCSTIINVAFCFQKWTSAWKWLTEHVVSTGIGDVEKNSERLERLANLVVDKMEVFLKQEGDLTMKFLNLTRYSSLNYILIIWVMHYCHETSLPVFDPQPGRSLSWNVLLKYRQFNRNCQWVKSIVLYEHAKIYRNNHNFDLV